MNDLKKKTSKEKTERNVKGGQQANIKVKQGGAGKKEELRPFCRFQESLSASCSRLEFGEGPGAS